MQSVTEVDSITTRVHRLVAESVNRSQDQVPLDARLDATQLGIDSLGLSWLGERLEGAFDITLPDLATEPGAWPLGTVRGVAEVVAREIARQRGARS
jgi:acyl carrier protein